MNFFSKIKRLFKKKKITGRWRYDTDGLTKIPVEDEK